MTRKKSAINEATLMAGHVEAVLRQVAQGVEDFGTECGSDRQQRNRAAFLAQTLRQIADGEFVEPIPTHKQARDGWVQVFGSCDCDVLCDVSM